MYIVKTVKFLVTGSKEEAPPTLRDFLGDVQKQMEEWYSPL